MKPQGSWGVSPSLIDLGGADAGYSGRSFVTLGPWGDSPPSQKVIMPAFFTSSMMAPSCSLSSNPKIKKRAVDTWMLLHRVTPENYWESWERRGRQSKREDRTQTFLVVVQEGRDRPNLWQGNPDEDELWPALHQYPHDILNWKTSEDSEKLKEQVGLGSYLLSSLLGQSGNGPKKQIGVRLLCQQRKRADPTIRLTSTKRKKWIQRCWWWKRKRKADSSRHPGRCSSVPQIPDTPCGVPRLPALPRSPPPWIPSWHISPP